MFCGNPNGNDITKKEGIYLYIQLIQFAVQQKLTQHYKTSTLQ